VILLADACALIVFHGYGGQTMSSAGKDPSAPGTSSSPRYDLGDHSKDHPGEAGTPCPARFQRKPVRMAAAGRLPHPAVDLRCVRAGECPCIPMHHKDPMDRMLIAIVLDRGMTVITDNDIFVQYGVSTLW